jgi:hypothetical protein
MSTPKKPAAAAAPEDVLTMALAQLQAAAAQVGALIGQIDQQLPGLIQLTPTRAATRGAVRNGEAKALLSVLDVADQYPALFQSLAADDQGNDPKTFEVGLLCDRLQRLAALQPLTDQLEERAQELSDTVLFLGELTKPVMLAAYRLAAPQAKHDPKIQTLMAPPALRRAGEESMGLAMTDPVH